MSLLGFDFGEKRIGVAVVPDDTTFALPLTTIEGDAVQKSEQIDDLIKRHIPSALVVGLPITMGGSEGEQSKATREFAHNLHEKYNIPVHLIDERLTSAAASAAGAHDIDAASAAGILDSYLAQSEPEDILDV